MAGYSYAPEPRRHHDLGRVGGKSGTGTAARGDTEYGHPDSGGGGGDAVTVVSSTLCARPSLPACPAFKLHLSIEGGARGLENRWSKCVPSRVARVAPNKGALAAAPPQKLGALDQSPSSVVRSPIVLLADTASHTALSMQKARGRRIKSPPPQGRQQRKAAGVVYCTQVEITKQNARSHQPCSKSCRMNRAG